MRPKSALLVTYPERLFISAVLLRVCSVPRSRCKYGEAVIHSGKKNGKSKRSKLKFSLISLCASILAIYLIFLKMM